VGGWLPTFSPDGKLLAWGRGGTVHLWDRTRGQEVGRLGCREGTHRVEFHGDGRTLVSWHKGGIEVWDTASRRRLWEFGGRNARRARVELELGLGERTRATLSVCPVTSLPLLRDLSTGEWPVSVRTGVPAWPVASPDGRLLAVPNVSAAPGVSTVAFFEVATGAEVGRLPPGHRGLIGALAFSPDGWALATGGHDSTILKWDWAPSCGLRPAPGKVEGRRLLALWDDLASTDARTAWAAIGGLAASPDQSTALLKARLRAMTAADCRPVRRWLAELDSDDFATRQKATAELGKLQADWLPLFFEALRRAPSLEAERRIRRLLAEPHKARWSPDMLRRLRAVAVLERVATPEARAVLGALAKGAPEARLTQEAQSALRRLEGRAGTRR
jgi:hypothetical protein